MDRQRNTGQRRQRGAVAATALIVSVAGCAAPSVAPSPSTIEPTTIPRSGVAPTAPVPVKTTLPPRSPGWMASVAWRPREPVGDLRHLTEEERLSFRAADLAQLALGLDLPDPPEVALERWIRYDEMGPVLSQCFSEAGVQALIDPTRHGFPNVTGSYRGPNDQEVERRTYGTPVYICHARFTLDPTYQQPPTRDQARVTYEFETEFWVPCVRAAGFDVLDPPPDREAAIEMILTGGRWPTWADGQEPEDGDRQAIYNACGDVMSPAAAFGY